MALIGFARVSSRGQDLDAQLAALDDHGCDKVFASKHSGAGKGKNLEKLKELIDYVRDGDTVVVTKIDRLGRSLKEVLQTIDALREKDVALKALQQPINTQQNDPFSNAMLQLLGVFAEMERNFIVERTQAGRERTGNWGGRKKTISTADRASIREAVIAGTTQYSLAKQYSVSKTTIHRIVAGR